MPFNLGFGELLLILVVVLLFFGAKRIPEIMGGFGKGIKEFKKSMNDVERELREPPPSSGSIDRGSPTDAARTQEENRPEPRRLMQ
jgi:sec-independent protein translocase protein TatA